jgi:hypothetical protein
MSWASYEPLQSTRPDAVIQTPTQFATQPPQQQKPAPVQVPEPKQPPAKSVWADISEYEELKDWVYIFIAVVVVEVILLFLVRYFPEFFGKFLNVWYNRFKLSAVGADILIIMIGIGIARYVYTEFIYPSQDWNPLYFTGTAVGVQILHDILFYFGVIRALPEGHNAMIDVFKQYGTEKGAGAILGDSILVIASCIVAMLLKSFPDHVNAIVGIGSAYVVPYILETKNQFSSLS